MSEVRTEQLPKAELLLWEHLEVDGISWWEADVPFTEGDYYVVPDKREVVVVQSGRSKKLEECYGKADAEADFCHRYPQIAKELGAKNPQTRGLAYLPSSEVQQEGCSEGYEDEFLFDYVLPSGTGQGIRLLKLSIGTDEPKKLSRLERRWQEWRERNTETRRYRL